MDTMLIYLNRVDNFGLGEYSEWVFESWLARHLHKYRKIITCKGQ